MKSREFVEPFRVTNGSKFRLKHFQSGETLGLKSKEHAREILEQGIARLSELQEKLYAQDRWAILMILQAMDAAGKDSTIKHVMSGVNPQGCQVHSFKAPTAEELQHDFLWRTTRSLPERGEIGIFNRSYYEEVLVVRVHPEILSQEKVPADLISKNIWKKRFEDINAFERYLSRNGILVLKFFLNLSKREQKKRFLDRLDEPEKNWKFSMNDVLERKCWDKYMDAYEDMIRNTSTEHAPWYVVPADHKWFSRLVVAEATVDSLRKLDVCFPELDSDKRRELKKARAALERTT
jgi:PPK2 family polyphosphate:nucleotide phosphotransferase